MKKSIIIFSIALIIVLITGCKTTQTANITKESLAGSNWQLLSVMGKEVSSADYAKGLPDAAFGSDDRISGNGGCNRYSGSYTLEENGTITFGTMISTKMFCLGGGETEFMKTIAQVTAAKIEGGNLVLSNAGTKLLIFKPKK